ncbi:MAG: amidohydrolase, partial [Clostridia bacterium]|nr:amidohydrolase [Clostridia bacterium]
MEKLLKSAEKHKQLILDAERYIWNNPETGFKEYKTSAYMAKIFEELGYTLTYAENIPGFYTTIDTGRPGPTLLIMGEMDSIICPEHKEADKETGAVHSCGHNVQCAALIGIAAALKDECALDDLSGKIKLCAVPAEELLEIEYRSELKAKGIIKYLGGKGEFLYRGYFDDVDLAFMVHASKGFRVSAGSVGCIAKKISYIGKASHAGGSPWNGCNALYAATCGLNAVNAIRETFKEKDIIRVHPIMTNGGVMVNAIPGRADIESYVRGASFEAMREANQKVNRAFCGAALSLGANIEINDMPGYAPLQNDRNMMKVAEEALELALPDIEYEINDKIGSGSTDMGDICSVMPAIHPYSAGTEGTSHGSDYYVTDPELACVGGAKFQLGMLYILLKDNAERAKKIVEEYKAPFASKQEYFDYIDTISTNSKRINYREDGI